MSWLAVPSPGLQSSGFPRKAYVLSCSRCPGYAGASVGLQADTLQRTGPAGSSRRQRANQLIVCSSQSRDRREVEENRDVEADPRYCRVDLSAQHAFQARQAFLQNIARGQAGTDLAAAALQVAAEDDALVSHSTVQLPIASYLQRLRRLASDAAALLADMEQRQQQGGTPAAAAGSHASSSGGSSSSKQEQQQQQQQRRRQQQLEAVQAYLYRQQRFRLPPSGRSNLPAGSVVDHPGVWESARYAYLNDCLVTREGIPALLAIVLADVMRRLLEAGTVDFAVRLDCSDMSKLPTVEILPLPPQQLLRPDGTALTTCSSAVLVELLRFLKRAYWPFPWHDRHGGFRGAATVFLEGDTSAAMQAINRTARHRLERGIWTSPGAGDIRRALAACERLVLLCGEEQAQERRDLAVLLMHVGRFRDARAELLRFQELSSAAVSRSEGQAGLSFALTPTGLVAALGQPYEDQVLTDRLLQLLPTISGPAASSSGSSSGSMGSASGSMDDSSAGSGGAGEQQQPGYLTLEAALARPPPPPTADEAARLPLTW